MLKPEQVPTYVAQKLHRMLYGGENNEAVLIAAALNAWPGMLVIDRDDDEGLCAHIRIPLPTEPRDE